MSGGDGGASRKFKKAARKIFMQTCGSLCHGQHNRVDHSIPPSVCCDSPIYSYPPKNQSYSCNKISSKIIGQPKSSISPTENSCTICLDPLNHSGSGGSPAQAIFTAQCSHSFHLACISSNVRHGSITCPICRAHWTRLPRNLSLLRSAKVDPALRILDDSIATSRVHRRRSFLRSARFDGDDPIEPEPPAHGPRLLLSLLSSPVDLRAHIRASLAAPSATDLVLVAGTGGPRLRLVKQAMALVVSSLRPADRLAVVACSSAEAGAAAAARVFQLRRMTPCGKRAALGFIDWTFCGSGGLADPAAEGLENGARILDDRAHRNPRSSILVLTDAPWRRPHQPHPQPAAGPVEVHHFDVGRGFGPIVREFEEFLAWTLGGAVRDVQMRVENGPPGVVRIGELRVGEERNVVMHVSGPGPVRVEYSYVEGGGDGEQVTRGDIVVGSEDKGDGGGVGIGGRMSSVESWDYHDPFMARRWAKHLSGYRF